jgi:hypothetical protein
VGPGGRRHLSRASFGFGSPEYPLNIGPKGTFRWKSPGGLQEEGFEVEESFIGHVTPWAITGSFEYRYSLSTPKRSIRCQTGRFPSRDRRVAFRAELRPKHH